MVLPFSGLLGEVFADADGGSPKVEGADETSGDVMGVDRKVQEKEQKKKMRKKR